MSYHIWKQQIGNADLQDGANAIAVDSTGNVYIAGYTYDTFNGKGGLSDGFVAKFNSDGAFQWQKPIGGEKADSARAIAVDPAGFIYVAGEMNGGFGSDAIANFDAFVTKFDTVGNQLWIQSISSPKTDSAYDLAINNSGKVYVTGKTLGVVVDNAQSVQSAGADAFIAKFKGDGTRLWIHQFGSPGDDDARSVAVDSAGNVYFTGFMPGSDNGFIRDAYLAKLTAESELVGSVAIGASTSNDLATGIAISPNDKIYVTGQTTGALKGANAGREDVFLAEFNLDGVLLNMRQFGTSGTDIANGVATDAAGNVYLAGYTEGTLGAASAGYNDPFLVKYESVA